MQGLGWSEHALCGVGSMTGGRSCLPLFTALSIANPPVSALQSSISPHPFCMHCLPTPAAPQPTLLCTALSHRPVLSLPACPSQPQPNLPCSPPFCPIVPGRLLQGDSSDDWCMELELPGGPRLHRLSAKETRGSKTCASTITGRLMGAAPQGSAFETVTHTTPHSRGKPVNPGDVLVRGPGGEPGMGWVGLPGVRGGGGAHRHRTFTGRRRRWWARGWVEGEGHV